MEQKKKVSSGRVLYFDLLNIAAALGVVYLHCNGMVHSFQGGGGWVFGLVIECVFYWAVPVFFMLTGATLIGYRKRYDTKAFFAHRFTRVVVPFLAWSLIWYLLLPGVNGGSCGLLEFVQKVAVGKIVSVYWFIYPLIGIYLSMPLLSLLDGRYSTQLYLICATFVLESLVFPLASQFGFQIGKPFVVSSASSYVMFVLLGNWLENNDLNKKQRILAYAFGAFGLLYRFVYTLVSSEAAGEVDRQWFLYCGFPSVFLAIAVFVWFKYHDWSFLQTKAPTIAKVASCTFGVYLIHYEVIHQICFERMGISGGSVLFRLFGAPIVFAAVALGVYLLKRIPVVRRIV
ncbi:acyltransferase [Thermophilibacter provencensis]|uniref:Acyltransferase family protein n=1 Tax=Thermophilibacter provencensis TaxID=1852386 RepID=A0ABT7V0P8_9ACTN|nr:acyltransferase family protein [Thermophilibacter provencensis]MDM8270163.1 acyltransferase family protein [Thermophilibacter provencensis]